jgi:hypothetical protein
MAKSKDVPTVAQLRNLERGLKDWFFPGPGQTRSCDTAESKGWLEGELCAHSAVMQSDGSCLRGFKRAYRTTAAGKKILKQHKVKKG